MYYENIYIQTNMLRFQSVVLQDVSLFPKCNILTKCLHKQSNILYTECKRMMQISESDKPEKILHWVRKSIVPIKIICTNQY